MNDYLAESYDKALRENELLRSRLAEAELSRDSWKREAELNQQAADESAGYARRLAEAEALLMELNQRPRHFEGGVYWLRTYTGDYERIARIVAPDSASVVQENSR